MAGVWWRLSVAMRETSVAYCHCCVIIAMEMMGVDVPPLHAVETRPTERSINQPLVPCASTVLWTPSTSRCALCHHSSSPLTRFVLSPVWLARPSSMSPVDLPAAPPPSVRQYLGSSSSSSSSSAPPDLHWRHHHGSRLDGRNAASLSPPRPH